MIAAAQETEKKLQACGLMVHLKALWTTMQWVEKTSQNSPMEAEFFAPGTIIVYPGTGDPALKSRAILRAIGQALEVRMSDSLKNRWEKRYTVAEEAHIDSFNAKVKANFSTYRSLVENSQDPVERLTHIHLSNALISNNVGIREADNIDVRKWGSTEQFATQKRYHSLIPLTSAYWPQGDKFCDAFACLVDNGLTDIYHTAVRKKIVEMAMSVVNETADLPLA